MSRQSPGRARRFGCIQTALLSMMVTAFLLLVLFVGGGWLLFLRPETNVEPGRPVQVEIDRGSHTKDIARVLAKSGVVANGNMFRLQSRIEEADSRMKPGVYDLATGMPYDLVIRRLIAGPPVEYVTVTIPEGFVIEQIAARLEKQVGIPADEFTALAKKGADRYAGDHPYLRDAHGGSMEGYLFPKTYRIRADASAGDVIGAMLDQFDHEWADLGYSAGGVDDLSTADIVVIGSMIERETRIPSERALVSSVIRNRLRRGMRLEIDATIEYVLPGNRFRLRYSDLAIDSPYNTYRNPGLPPGPICNPGAASLKAAASPAGTRYLYYVLTGKDGSHTFTANKSDFERAKKKSKEVFGR